MNRHYINIIAHFLIISAIGAVMFLWLSDAVKPNNLLFEVKPLCSIPFLETKYLYALIHIFCFLPVFLLSFDKRVSYYKKWGMLSVAIGIVGAFFIIWDIIKTAKGVWGFNEKYYEISIINLPLEEWLFFITIPFCCVFIYECLNYYIPKDYLKPFEPAITQGLIFFFFAIGILFWGRSYTATTFLLNAAFLLFHKIYFSANTRSRFYLAYLVSCIPFIIVNGILTGAFTQEPVVVYNPEEYLGIRFVTIPFDDFAYSFLLFFMVITTMSFLEKRKY